MSDPATLVVEHLSDKTLTVGFTAKRSDGNYGSDEATVFYPYEKGATPEETQTNAAEALAAARDLAVAELVHGPREAVEAHGPRDNATPLPVKGTDLTAHELAESFNAEVEDDRQVEAHGPRVRVERAWDKEDVPDWLFEQAAEAGVTSVVDKRRFAKFYNGPNAEKAPWFQATDGTKDRNDKFAMGFWPPKGWVAPDGRVPIK